MKDKLLKLFYTIMLSIAFIYIGSPVSNEIVYPIYVAIDILAMIVILCTKNIKLNKKDMLVMLLCLSTFIPLIFKTYVSLERGNNKYF